MAFWAGTQSPWLDYVIFHQHQNFSRKLTRIQFENSAYECGRISTLVPWPTLGCFWPPKWWDVYLGPILLNKAGFKPGNYLIIWGSCKNQTTAYKRFWLRRSGLKSKNSDIPWCSWDYMLRPTSVGFDFPVFCQAAAGATRNPWEPKALQSLSLAEWGCGRGFRGYYRCCLNVIWVKELCCVIPPSSLDSFWWSKLVWA